MAKKWNYASAPGSQAGDMRCTACGKQIESGQFRFSENDRGYHPQHRACSTTDPEWAKLDGKRRDQEAFYARRQIAYDKFVAEFGIPDDLVDGSHALIGEDRP